MAIKQYLAGEVIYREGDTCRHAYIILQGHVELTYQQAHLRTVIEGESFGGLSLLQLNPYSETALAKTDVNLQILSSMDLDGLIYDSPPEIQKLVTSIVRQEPLPEAPPAAAAATPAEKPAPAMPASSLAQLESSVVQVTDLLAARIEQLRKRIADDSDGPDFYNNDGSPPAIYHLTSEFVKQLNEMGPLKPLLEDDTVNDILINGTASIYVERNGLLQKTALNISSEADVMRIAEKITSMIGRKLDPNRPMIDARLLDGSRVNIVGAPLAVDGTSISIRKFSRRNITIDFMKEQANVSDSLGEFLKIIGKCRLNTIISGGTGSGKTTLLNAISQFIDPSERIVTIEDAAELRMQQPHIVRLETRPLSAGVKRSEEVTIRDLVRNALRMRPDRIIVGEVRGPEAFDMMQAMNTGHEGSLTTIHANHPRDALSRLENMISMANLQIPMKSLRYQIASALHLIVQISRMRDGQRRVTHVSEVVGMEGDMITMHDLFNYVVEGEDEKGKLKGYFKWSNIMPRFIRRVAYYGEQDRLEKALGIKLPKNDK